jgi:uncharacterized protein with ParB-like and HNH nuclease domain
MSAKPRRQNFQTISWFNDLHKRQLLELDPPYQRRSVWNQAYKNDFIDTVLRQFPAPAIFLFEEISPEGASKYYVVDGKQRLTAIFEFASGLFPVAENAELTHLRGKYFDQLSNDEKTLFWTYEFPVEYLPTNEEGLINEIFQRINKNTAKLTAQELRHARFNGPFITAAEDLAAVMNDVFPENFPRIESQSRKQMKDVELVANLLLLIEGAITGSAKEDLGEIRGYSQDELDGAFSERDSHWEYCTQVVGRFNEVVKVVDKVVRRPDPPAWPLYKTRLRNQADFYSLFGAVSAISQNGAIDPSADLLAERLGSFIEMVENEESRNASNRANNYFSAARSNSNDSGSRRSRVRIIRDVLTGKSE